MHFPSSPEFPLLWFTAKISLLSWMLNSLSDPQVASVKKSTSPRVLLCPVSFNRILVKQVIYWLISGLLLVIKQCSGYLRRAPWWFSQFHPVPGPNWSVCCRAVWIHWMASCLMVWKSQYQAVRFSHMVYLHSRLRKLWSWIVRMLGHCILMRLK